MLINAITKAKIPHHIAIIKAVLFVNFFLKAIQIRANKKMKAEIIPERTHRFVIAGNSAE